MSTRRVGGTTATAISVLLAFGSACSILGVGPRYLGALGVAADGLAFSMGVALLHRRAGHVPGPPWVPVVRFASLLLMTINTVAGVSALLVAVAPAVRSRTHSDVDLSNTPS